MLNQPFRLALRARNSAHAIRSSFVPRRSPINQIRLASQDYGSGSGDPAGETPQKQGQHKGSDLEHPGPPPPDVGQKGAGATSHTDDGGNSSSNNQASPSSSSSSSSSKSTGVAPEQQDTGHSDQTARSSPNGAQPRFNTEPADQNNDDVKKHNEDVDARKVRSKAVGGDRSQEVGKGFWSGQGGADRDP